MTPEEQVKIQAAYTAVQKAKKETDKTRFSNYEYEVRARYPYLKKNEAGIFFNYVDGVYKIMNDQDVSGIILNMLYEDMLWGYRTKRNVADKVACLLSIVPDLELTNDKGDCFSFLLACCTSTHRTSFLSCSHLLYMTQKLLHRHGKNVSKRGCRGKKVMRRRKYFNSSLAIYSLAQWYMRKHFSWLGTEVTVNPHSPILSQWSLVSRGPHGLISKISTGRSE